MYSYAKQTSLILLLCEWENVCASLTLAEDSAVLIGNGKRITKVKTSHSGFILS
jgi:hypothetical protein